MSDATFTALSKRLDRLTHQVATTQQVDRWGMPRSALVAAHGRVRGARTKYTVPCAKTIVEAVGLGASYALAAEAAGIDEETLRVWLRRKPAFAVALKKAAARGMMRHLARINLAAQEG